MKIVIKEDKRDRLAKQILTEEFSGMYEDVNYYTDSMGEKMRIEYRNGDSVIMIYGSAAESLYICEDVISPLRMLSYTQKQVRDIIGEWFSEFFELPVEIVHYVNKAVLN
jgi:hypothetical protein